ncbi:MAG TPA: DUF4450 domain-containing protein [Bacteroidales bacterium]|nr:DUF4450 domain-containing protein [Bacteroidales bacterium]
MKAPFSKMQLMLTILLVLPLLCVSQTPYWHNQVREIRYQPVGEEFVNVNGDKRFSRAIYGTNTGFRFETSDFPEFGLYMPNLGGSVYLAVKRGDKVVWAKDLEWVESRFVSGKRVYTLKDKSMMSSGLLKLTALALSDADGFILQTEAKGLPSNVQLLWIYGAASDKRFSRNGDIGADPSDCFWIAASKCNGNQFDIQGNTFSVSYGKGKKLNGLFPKGSVLKRADAAKIDDLEKLLNSETSETPLLIASQPVQKGIGYTVFYNPTTHAIFSEQQLNQAFNMAETFRSSIADRVKIETPDPYLNTLGGILSGAEDAIWEAPSYLHGAIGWRVPLTGWRGSYLADVLGFHDRARMHFDGYAKAQVTNVPVILPPTQDPQSNLSRAEKTWGTPMYSNGYICRYPNKTTEMNHYDMNLVYIDELLWHLNWTGDWKYARQIFPVIKRHLAWEKLVFDPDNDGLYDGYCCIWASDGLQYNGGVATHSTAYNYRANRMAAMLAEKLGEDASLYRLEAEKILRALNHTLWIGNKGWWAEFKDNMGEKMLHEDAAVWTVYHAIDSEVQDPFQAYEATRYVDSNIPHIPVLANNLEDKSNYVISTSDWQTYNWSINNVALAEVTHTALAFWQAGREDEAYKMYKGALLDAMYMGSGPGNITQISFYDAARGESYRDFADPVATTARALVQGLFGILPDLLNQKLIVRPGFPTEWNHASLQTKNMRFKFNRNQNIDHYEIEPNLRVNGNLTLEVNAFKDQIRSITVNGKKVDYHLKTEAISLPKIVIEAGLAAAYDITIVWGGNPISDIPATWEVQQGKSYHLDRAQFNNKIYDPEGVLKNTVLSDSTFTCTIQGTPGHRTVFAQVRQGAMEYWKPLDFHVADTAWISSSSDTLRDLTNVHFEKVNLTPFFNDRVRDIWAYGKYLSPRWPYTTLNVPTQGMGEWTHPEDLYKIDDRGIRTKAGAINEIRMPGGVPFSTPGDLESNNVVFTTLWDNYPKSVTIPLSGSASKIYLLLAASTYHMQNHVLNGTITAHYTDGTSDILKLVLPETLLPLDQDIYTDGFAFTLKTPRPYRIRLKTGTITTTPAADLYLKQGNGPLLIDGGLATMSELRLNPLKELKSLELRTIANEVIIGLMSATLVR